VLLIFTSCIVRRLLPKTNIKHRDDQEAFYAYIDRLHAEANWIEMPPLESLQDLDNYPEFVERFRGNSQA